MNNGFRALKQIIFKGGWFAILSPIQVLAVSQLLLISCSSPAEPPAQVRPVKVERVLSYNEAKVSYSGVVAPKEFVNLAFRMGGPLISVNVVEGGSVKSGEVIARVDPTDYRLDMEAKKATYLTVGQQIERYSRLLERNAVSKQDFESLRAQYENARAAYENSLSILEQTTLKAPFDGFIQEKYVENYQEVTPGQKIVCLINPNKLQIQATLPDRALPYLTSSPKVWVEFDAYKGKRFVAKITEYIQSSPDGSGVPIFVEITDPSFNLDSYKIAIGFSCRVGLEVDLDNHQLAGDAGTSHTGGEVVVPLSGVVQKADGYRYVFVYEGHSGKVRQQKIEGGEVVGRGFMVVEKGLAPGDLVVSAGASRLADGERVILLEAPQNM